MTLIYSKCNYCETIKTQTQFQQHTYIEIFQVFNNCDKMVNIMVSIEH